MRRRQVLQSILSLPAITALPAAAQEAPKPVVDETPKLEMTLAEAAAEPAPHFFTPQEMETLRKVSQAILPAMDGKPGAVEAGVPEFLDFLLERSPADRQELYRSGLARLSGGDFEEKLAALRQPWTFSGPSDDLGRFLAAAKEDVLRATFNSHEWAATSTGRRGNRMGSYWYPVE